MPHLATLPPWFMRWLAAALLQEPAARLACNCLHHLSPRPLGGNGLPREVTSSLLRSACGRTASRHIISISNIVRIYLIIVMDYFVDTQTVYAEDTTDINLGAFGGATLSVEPTPQMRGPLPKPIWRRGRLPNCLARPRRPPPSWNLQLPCRHFHDALRQISVSTLLLVSIVTAARAQI